MRIDGQYSPGSYWSSSHWRSAYLVIGLVTDGWPPILSLYFKVIGGPPVAGTPIGSRIGIMGINLSPLISIRINGTLLIQIKFH